MNLCTCASSPLYCFSNLSEKVLLHHPLYFSFIKSWDDYSESSLNYFGGPVIGEDSIWINGTLLGFLTTHHLDTALYNLCLGCTWESLNNLHPCPWSWVFLPQSCPPESQGYLGIWLINSRGDLRFVHTFLPHSSNKTNICFPWLQDISRKKPQLYDQTP